jgi:uncharacterized membrane protein YdjX (TVP38/TMEM64 family)
MKLWLRITIFVIVIAVLIAGVQVSGLGKYLTLDYLLQYRDALNGFVSANYALSALLYILAYFAVEAFALPVATVLTLVGGYLFGWIPAVLFVNIGATAGACGVFLLTRYFIGQGIQKKYSEKLAQFNRELEENGVSYFLVLRLVPLFPFFMVNLFAGLTRVSFLRFLWTTSVGIIPGSAVYAFAGGSLASIRDVKDILSPGIIAALLLLAALSAIPLAYKKLTSKKKEKSGGPGREEDNDPGHA